MTTTADLCAELQALQRRRSVVLKSRIMQANRLQAVVAGTLGYHSGLTEAERTKLFKQAAAVIKAVAEDEPTNTPFADIIRSTLVGIEAFDAAKAKYDAAMTKVAKRLPVAAWVQAPEQRGFGLLFLGIVVGECGDLANYANPAKVWRRMGCAPWSFGGQTRMGATWRAGKEGKLPADQWESFGYSPRRRSIAYLIGEGLVKQNTLKSAGGESCNETENNCAPGPYRARWMEAKHRAYVTHPEWGWGPCKGPKQGGCKGDGCPVCGGLCMTCKRAHLHGMLLATKRLLRDLWCEWNQKPAGECTAVTERNGAGRLLDQA